VENAETNRLNAAADRDLPQLQEAIKAENDTTIPGLCQIGRHPFFQSPEPMTLAGSADTGQPSILARF
jgi:hypothetical protein